MERTPTAERHRVRRQLAILALGGGLLLAMIGSAATFAQHTTASSEQALNTLSKAQRFNMDANDQHEALRGDVFAALLFQSGSATFDDATAITDDAAANGDQLLADDAALGRLDLHGALRSDAADLRKNQQAYVAEARGLVSQAVRGKKIDLARFDRDAYDVLELKQNQFTSRVSMEYDKALADHHRARRLALVGVWSFVGLALLLLVAVFIGVRRSVLGVTLRLENLLDTNETEAERGEFGRRVVDALDMADDETAARAVTSRAFADVHPSLPMELLLADSSKAHLEQAAVHPSAGAPGCGVQTPFACVAVRRGAAVTFPDSERLDACPRLREHANGPLSAACVPVTFMGRAIGVLHASAPVGEPPDGEIVERLARVASYAGARIGTLRATHRTQIHAATDALTGLANRRTLEDELRRTLRAGGRFALAFADLDHFKQLNDTYGHETGDRALRLFAKALQTGTRDADILARYGGEEFVIVFPDSSVAEAHEVLERLRVTLQDVVATSDAPAFTASFGLTDSSAGRTVDEIVSAADEALLAAKSEGRNRVVVSATQLRPPRQRVK